ncbi:hypothetical protein AAG906_008126 [Vitis piasezkii]
MTAWKHSTHRWISEGKDGKRTYRLQTHTLEGRCDDANMESSRLLLYRSKRGGKVKEKPKRGEEEEGGRRGSETLIISCRLEQRKLHAATLPCIILSLLNFIVPVLVALVGWRRCLSVGHRIFMEKLHTLLTRMQQSQMRRNPPVLPLTNMDKGHRVPITNMDAVYTVPTGTSPQ